VDANQIKLILHDAGYDVVGPVGELTPALAMAHSKDICAALLDIDIEPEADAYPVADVLRKRQVPYAFVSSHPYDQVAPGHADRPFVAKPFQPASIEMVIKVLAPAPRVGLQ
jgi:hypothetical protein